MATFQALIIVNGTTTQIPTSDELAVGSGITTESGNLSVGSAGGTTTLADATLDVDGAATFSAAGTAVTVDNNMQVDGNLNVNGTLTAGSIVAGGLVDASLTTTAMTGGAGQFGYVSAASTVTPTDNLTIAKSRTVGAYTGTVGQMQVDGVVPAALFTTVGGSPSNGAPVYLAASTDEASAVGKLTATAPTTAGTVVAEVGICVDNGNYAGAKTAKVLMQVKSVIQL